MRRHAVILAAAAMSTCAGAASAAPLLNGSQLSISLFAQPVGAVTVNMATGIDFVSGPNGASSLGAAGNVASYGFGTGSFAGLFCSGGACGLGQDLPSLTLGAHPIANFLTLAGGNVIVDLATITGVNRLSSSVLAFYATGTIRYGSFDPTAAGFTFTLQGDQILSAIGTAGTAAYNLGSSVDTTAVFVSAPIPVLPVQAPLPSVNTPEPASLALLCGALATLAARQPTRRRA